MRSPLAPLCLLAALALAACGDAPEATARRWELVEVPDRGESSVQADLDVALGTVTVGEAERGALFQAEVALPFEDLRPILRSTTQSTAGGPQAVVRLGLEGESASLRDLRKGRGVDWRLLFSHRTPLDLTLRLGAAQADLDLSGVPLRRLGIEAGVAKTHLRFTRPNPEPLRQLSIQAGVSEFEASGLGFARFERLQFTGGVGRFRLDFSGDAVAPGARADIEVGLGALDLVLPDDAPTVLQIPTSRMSAVRLPAGLATLGGGRYGTPGAADDPDALVIQVQTGPGRVTVLRPDSGR